MKRNAPLIVAAMSSMGLASAMMHHQQSAPLVVDLSNGSQIKMPTKLNHRGEPFTNADQDAIDKAKQKRERKGLT